jgi:hypothetical protein
MTSSFLNLHYPLMVPSSDDFRSLSSIQDVSLLTSITVTQILCPKQTNKQTPNNEILRESSWQSNSVDRLPYKDFALEHKDPLQKDKTLAKK